MSAVNLVELLEERASAPGAGYAFLKDGRAIASELSYPELAQQARAIAAQLQQQVSQGSRALLLYPPGLSFLPGFFGCLYAGVIAIPVPPPPDSSRLRSALIRLGSILKDAEPELLLTTSSLAAELEETLKSFLPNLRWLLTDEVDASLETNWQTPLINPQSLAYLQYTSGSTSAPRGVMLSHANVLHNLGDIRPALGYDADSVSVSWMPYFHDYGLVEGLLQPLYSNIPSFILSPLTVLKRPLRWLQAIHQYRATHTHGPNFAYEMCLQRITPEQRAGLDLSSVKLAGTGAEPVRADTMRRFSEAFAPHGFRGEVYPGYGLAEATLIVTARQLNDPLRDSLLQADALKQHQVKLLDSNAGSDESSRTVISCGVPLGVNQVRIVNAETRRICPPDQIGEIWISSPSVALGYWRKEEETAATFQARLVDDSTERPFLRTGDLGFLREGELYVTGRLKDMLIFGGVNHYPQDIEWTVQSHCPELRRDCCVVCSIERDGVEQLVVIAEPERPQADWTPLLRRIREAVATNHELAVAAIALAKRGSVLKTSSGKLQRNACRLAFLEGRLATFATWESQTIAAPVVSPARPNLTELQGWICQLLAASLRLDPREIDLQAPFAEYGLDSRSGVALVAALEDRLGGVELSPAMLWQYPSVSALSKHLSENGAGVEHRAEPTASTIDRDEDVAIVGLSCRFPGAANPQEFWDLLREGRSAIVASPRLPGIKAGFLSDVEDFDADFFGVSANEALAMDPQQRLLLEVAWEALENAGLAPQQMAGRRGGIFIGISAADHGFQQFSRPDAEELINAHSGTGLAFSVAANRLSYHLNLTGPSMAIDTACSSSLVAVHQASQSLKNGECDLALAGGVNLMLSPFTQLALQRAGMLSPDQLCKTFDAGADGYVRGEGCGIVVLKRLSDVRRDGDAVLAVIRASAINQDGRSNGLTAPNPAAQEALLRQALAQAGLPAKSIEYVETHGTGTRLGDPIEMSALQAVLSDGRRETERCWVGSVKANIGHLEAAAGIAGLIKVVLALQYGEVPPHLNLQKLNPLIKLAGTAFAIADSLQPWPGNVDERRPEPRLAAVSSFGFGGTNAHVILEQGQSVEEAQPPDDALERTAHLFTLSAHSHAALRELASRYAAYLKARPETSLADLCFTTSVHRTHHQERLALPASSSSELAAQLEAFADGERVAGDSHGRASTQPPRVAFLFSGQGAQYLGMARQLFETQPSFRAILQECDALTRDVLERPLLSVIFGDEAKLLDQTAYTQPALFAVEYALARLWQQWGVEPAALLGHSVGEYVAACLAGVFSFRDGLRLIAARGRLIQQLPLDGAMLVVLSDEAYLREAIRDCSQAVSIAAVNAPQNVALSGARDELERLEKRFMAEGITCRFLPVSHAFHSPLMTPILESFRDIAAGLDYSAPGLTLISNIDGAPLDKAPDAEYWTRHLRQTVRFADGIRRLGESYDLFLEIGPRPVLSQLGAQCLSNPQVQWLPSLKPGTADWNIILDSLSRLYVAGVTPNLQGFDSDYTRRRLNGLPTYPFQRRRFALPPLAPVAANKRQPWQAVNPNGNGNGHGAHLPNAKKVVAEIAAWGYVPQWQPAPVIAGAASKTAGAAPKTVGDVPAEWLLLADEQGVAEVLQARLEQSGQTCSLDATNMMESMLVETQAAVPLHVVCLWGLDWPEAAALETETLPSVLKHQVGRLLTLLQRLATQGKRDIRLWLISRAAFAITPESKSDAPDGQSKSDASDGLLQSLLWGLGRTLRHEYPDWQIRLVDLQGNKEQAAEQLFNECLSSDAQAEVCWRGEQRYAGRLQQHSLEPINEAAPLSDTWLITGGMGRLGLSVAEWLVGRGVRHLLLIGRRPPGPGIESRLVALGALGASVRVRAVDVSDEGALRELLAETQSEWPPLQGLVHAAGVLDDGILFQQTPDRFNAVLAPKVLGGWNLHLLTEHLPLRYFVLFSSLSSLLGNPGQSAYAAANAFLDALASYRQARGLPALSLNWSTWAEAAEAPKVASRMEQHGLVPIDHDKGLEAFERALSLGLPQLAIVPMLAGLNLELVQQTEHAAASLKGQAQAAMTGLLRRLQQDARGDLNAALQEHILGLLASILGRSPETLDPQRGFADQGLDSLNIVELRNRLQRDLEQPLPITLPFNYPTATALADELLRQFGSSAPMLAAAASPGQLSETVNASTDGIAIISMSCRLPGGVSSAEEFWTMLRDGVDAITEVPADRWDVEYYYHPDPDHPGTIVTRSGGFVSDVEEFDAVFFGISPREARHLDPQQRLLLEVCWETIERAGIPPSSLLGTQTGVFVGISNNDYTRRLNRPLEEIDAYIGTGNALSIAANRLSYTFGIEGPSLAIDTACSSSLVAIHQACQSLRDGESDMAIAGGVNLILDPAVSINHSRAHMLSVDGRCKAFSADADGMGRAEGCGLVFLKRLSDALQDGDPVLAVIRGSAVNQDGRTSGLTVPNGLAQQRVIRRALRQARLEPSAVSYVEAHGTGTPLGDPIEAEALAAVFGEGRERIAVGSVKTNLGHAESASGVVGLIKTVLALQHKEIPAHLHCESLNPRIDWGQVPLRIPVVAEAWPDEAGPRRAGVNSFGFGGTNSHVILEEAPTLAARQLPALSRYLLPLSAKTETALRTLARQYAAYLETTTDHPADICYTAACGRDHFVQRLAVMGDTTASLRARLLAWLEDEPGGDIRFGTVTSAKTNARASNRTRLASTAAASDWADMAAFYVQGMGPDWTACYSGLNLRRVLLPGHPFERQSYAVVPPSPATPHPQSYEMHWTLQPEPPPLSNVSDHWLIFADAHGWGEALATELEGRGARCTVVYRGPSNNGQRSLPPCDDKALLALLEEVGMPKGILHLWSLDNPSLSMMEADNLLESQRQSLGSVLQLVQTLKDRPQPPRLWLVSQAAQAVLPEDGLEGLAQTTLWGLGRTLALELPWLWGGLLDLPCGTATGQDVEAVCSILYSTIEDSQMALRAGRFHVPRLRQLIPERRREVNVRPDASYLITGGFGSLGRELGRWLARQGARNLWLFGRNGATSPEAVAYIEELNRLGVTTRVAALDIANAPELEAQLAEWLKTGPPLRGVIHAAGLNAETPLATLDWPTLAMLLGPKLQGTWALQQSTAELDLDFFINCSSIAALWGSQRQAAYTAANAFLDGLAAYRHARGQTALSINWGPLASSAMLNEAASANLRSFGIQATPLTSAPTDLLPLLLDGATQVVLVAMDWRRFVPLYQSRCPTGLFDALLSDATSTDIETSAAAPDISVRLDSPADLRAWATGELSDVLRLPPQQLDADTPLTRLGLDSLMAVNLRNRLQQQLGRAVSLTDLLGDLSLNGLVQMLASPPPTPPAARPVETVAQTTVAQTEWVTGEI